MISAFGFPSIGELLSKNVSIVICTGSICSSTNCFSIKGSGVSDRSPIPNITTAMHIPEIIAPIVKDGTCNVCLLLFFGESFFSEIV